MPPSASQLTAANASHKHPAGADGAPPDVSAPWASDDEADDTVSVKRPLTGATSVRRSAKRQRIRRLRTVNVSTTSRRPTLARTTAQHNRGAQNRGAGASAARKRGGGSDDEWEPCASGGSSDGEGSDSSWDAATSSSDDNAQPPQPLRRTASRASKQRPRTTGKRAPTAGAKARCQRRPARTGAAGAAAGAHAGTKPVLASRRRLPLAMYDQVLASVSREVEAAAAMAPLGLDQVVVNVRRSALRDGHHNVLLLLVLEKLHLGGCFEEPGGRGGGAQHLCRVVADT